MGGAFLLLTMASVLVVDPGCEPDGQGGFRYVLQLTPEQLASLREQGSLTSRIPAELRSRVTEIEIRVGGESPPNFEIASNRPSPYPAPPDVPRGDTVRGQQSGGFDLPDMNEMGRQASDQLRTSVGDGMDNMVDRARAAGEKLLDDAAGAARGATGELLNGTSGGPSTAPNFGPSTSPGGATLPPNGSPRNSLTQNGGNAAGVRPPTTSRTTGGPSTSTPAASPPSGGFGPSTSRSLSPDQTGGNSQPNRVMPPDATASGADSTGRSSPFRTGPSAPGTDYGTGGYRSSTSGSVDPPSMQNNGQNGGQSAGGVGLTGQSGGNSGAVMPPNGYGASNAGGESEIYEFWDPRSGLTPTEQRNRDRTLLSEVDINESGKVYDLSTGRTLSVTDPRFPQMLDYLVRIGEISPSEQAELLRQTRLSAGNAARQPPTGLPNYGGAPTNGFGQPVTTPAGNNVAWGNATDWPAQDPRYAQAGGGYAQTGGGYGQSGGLVGGGNLGSAAGQTNVGAGGQGGGRGGGDGTETGGNRSSDGQETAGSGKKEEADERSLSDTPPGRSEQVESRPLINFFLLMSLVANIYLMIAISRLLRRYRNLVATNRGSLSSI